MDVFAQFATDEVKENEGVEVELGDGAKILVGRSGNKKYSRLLTAMVEKNQRTLDLKNDAADKLSDDIMIDVMAQTILLGFSGMKWKGQPLPYSVENAKMLLGVKDFRRLVARHSDDFEKFRAAHESALGNG